MRPGNDRFRGAGGSNAGGTSAVPIAAVPSQSAGVPPAFDPTTAGTVISRSRGYLPHFDAPNLVQHIVFRLVDSLPGKISEDIAKSRRDRIVAFDAALDAGHGGRDLARREIASLVQTALLTFDGERYAVAAWCVMPNHVHVLVAIKPGYTLNHITHSWKSYTAKEANRILGRIGRRFWAPEYFDRFMRDERHLARTAGYIEGNPVKAGLCENVADWRFSSAWQGWLGRDARGPEIHL